LPSVNLSIAVAEFAVQYSPIHGGAQLRRPPQSHIIRSFGPAPRPGIPRKEGGMDIQDKLRAHLRTASRITVSIIASLLLYLAVAEFIRARFRPFLGFLAVSDIQLLRYAFFALAVATVVIIMFLRPRLLRKVASDDDKTVLHRVQRAFLITIVLAEVPGTLGLLLFLMAGLNIDFYFLLFASLLLVFMYFPRHSAWEEWLS
jgi:hypothetical protein